MANPKKIFSQIYDAHIDKIYRFIFLKVNSREIAEDLCSEAFLRGWQAFKNQKEIENPSAFLYQIARNLIIDHYRDKGRTQLVSADCLPIIDPKTNLEAETMNNSDIETIKASLADIKDEYREVIVWHYLDDLPIAEIATMLNKSEGAIRVTLHRALKALKNQVSDRETDTV